MGSESIPVPISLLLPATCSEDVDKTCKDLYVKYKENEHLIKNLSGDFRQLQSIDAYMTW